MDPCSDPGPLTDGRGGRSAATERQRRTMKRKHWILSNIKNQRFIFIEMHLLLQGCVSADNVTHTEMCVCCHVVRSLWFQRCSTFSCLFRQFSQFQLSALELWVLNYRTQLIYGSTSWMHTLLKRWELHLFHLAASLCWKLFLEQ